MLAQQFRALASLVGLVAVVSLADTPSAEACGGCFAPLATSTETTGVSAHRMVLSMSARETVLWDQIVYDGNPRDFVWVLPVAGEPLVELADNGFFEALSSVTAITLTGPPLVCPTGSGSVRLAGPVTAAERGPLASQSLLDPDSASSVSVLYQGVVGPYETAILRSTSSTDLVDWLIERHYRVPEDTVPLIASYAELGMNFVVLRLAGQEGADRIQPVRITVPGISTSLPLRMIAAGTGATTDLELFVLAEGRMEVSGAPNSEVDREAISFDWLTGTFDYAERFEDALFAGALTDPTAWVTEAAFALPVETVRAYRSTGPSGEEHSAAADLDVVLATLPEPYLTRLRTRLPRAELDHDLVLRASLGGELETNVVVTNELNRDALCTGGGVTPSPTAPPRTPPMRPLRTCSRCVASHGTPSSGLAAVLIMAFAVALRRSS